MTSRDAKYFGWLAAILTSVVGCGEDTGLRGVSGVVTINGEAVPTGNIVFQPVAGGRPSSGKIQSDGTYSLSTFEKNDGVSPGEYVVSINAKRAVGEVTEGQRRPIEMEWIVPQRYASFETSRLTADVVDSGRNKINFALSRD